LNLKIVCPECDEPVPGHTPACSSNLLAGVVRLGLNWGETERGNVWLVWPESGDCNAWIRLPTGRRWLQIAIRQGNYPGLNVSIIEVNSDEDIWRHICQNCVGMTIRKLNLQVTAEQHLIEEMIAAGEVLDVTSAG
jgi:hypothetical protein